MIYVGAKVKIKPIEQINRDFLNIYSGVPVWATPRMKSYYGNGEVYTVNTVSYFKRSYDSEPNIYLYLKEIDHCWYLDDIELVDMSEAIIPEYTLGDIVMVKINNEEPTPSMITGVCQYPDRTTYEVDDCFSVNSSQIFEKCKPGTKVHIKKYCSRCDSFYTIDPNEELDDEDKRLCPTCRKREFITPYHSFSPKITFHKLDNENDNLFFGVELEVDDGGEVNENARDVMRILNENSRFTYCSHDGSLDDGFEIITQPATIEYHKSLEKTYRKAFKHLLKKGYRSHDTSTCGIHVHFSRDYYAENEEDNIAKLLYLVEKFWDEIVVFSRRDYRTLERYAKKIDADANEFIRVWNKKDHHSGHYYAVNISNPNTIELRMFKGTLNYDTYIAIIEFVNSIVRIAKEKTVSELQRLEFKEILTPLCLEYYNSRRGDRFAEVANKDEVECDIDAYIDLGIEFNPDSTPTSFLSSVRRGISGSASTTDERTTIADYLRTMNDIHWF